MNEKTKKSEPDSENIYDEIVSNLAVLDLSKEDQKEFINHFWKEMTREEKIVFTIDALTSFKRQGVIKGFLYGVNLKIKEKQNEVLDNFIDDKISFSEVIESMEKLTTIEL